jgi:regulator of protease activity HflC (stomatin/prohibitin superfamily)
MFNLTFRSITAIALSVIGLLLSPMIVMQMWEGLDASEIMVIQSPISGELRVFTEPGVQWQGFGKVTKYPRRDQYSFSSAANQGKPGDQSISTGFNDGGTGKVSGVMSWEPPLKPEHMIRLHKEYGGFHAIDQQLIRPMLEKVIFSAGATMSSIESSSERRPEIPQVIDDQLQNGPYLTKVATVTTIDPLTKQEKAVRIVQLATDKDGKPMRASASTIKEYGITLSPVTINHIDYEASVKAQIAERQKSTQAVQLSQAAAIRATQDAITTEQQGKANAAKAKWEQETVNAKDIALSEKTVVVAKNEALAAEQYKRKLILEGEGEAAKKRMVMEADGALEKKLEAYVKVSGFYANAIQTANPGAWTPAVVMGGSGGNTNGASALVDLFTAKAAKDLGIDLRAAGAANTAKK